MEPKSRVRRNGLVKRSICAILITLLFLSAIPVSLVCVGFCLPSQYDNTYYAVLPKMYRKLENTEGKKIVVVGNSAIAFGLDPLLLEGETDGYTVCPFGLYGAIGTKAMMDLSRVNIREGDIVILAPEQMGQSMSLYFNSEYVWNAADGDFGILSHIENTGEMVGGFLGYVGRKYGYYSSGSKPSPTDVYAASSFDENCKMIYERAYNVLPLGYDAVERVSFDLSLFPQEFADYVNEYNAFLSKRGATLLYGFALVNVMGIAEGTAEEDIDAFYDRLDGLLDCEILGNPKEYILEKEWFYDSNVHVNSAGMTVYTDRLVRDLKAYLGDSSADDIVLPEKPLPPDDGAAGENGKDAALFTYEESGNGWNITGLTEEGRAAASVEIPDFYEGKKVLSFDAAVFAGNTSIEEIRIGKYIYAIAGSSFDGCSSLKRLYLPADNRPSECMVYLDLLKGASACMVYVPRSKLADYTNDYFWSRYAAYLVGY